MSEIERFLEPIETARPAGQDVRYVLHDKIKEARRQEGVGPMGAWEREAKTADYKQVIKLAESALLKTSKDLWLAAWLTEAWTYEYEIPGLTSGLQLLHGLVDRFWDYVYPELDEGDAEMRATPLEWVGSYFDPAKGSSPIFALRSVGLTKSGYSWFVYQESRRIGFETEVKGNDARKKARELALKEGKIAPEEFDKDFEGTPKQLYRDLEREGKVALETLHGLDEICREKFGDVAPSFNLLRTALDELANSVHILLQKKLEKDPDPPPAVAEQVVPEAPVADNSLPIDASGQGKNGTAALPVQSFHLSNGPIGSTEEAVQLALAAANYLRQHSPASPVSYSLLRALRWGEVRASGASLPAVLPAPSSEVRVHLKAAAAAGNWKSVLDIAEMAMSSETGRGWLDLQRYVIRACEQLGYAEVAKALRSYLKAFLTDYPQLPNALLSDDTGAANPETSAWLKQEALISEEAGKPDAKK